MAKSSATNEECHPIALRSLEFTLSTDDFINTGRSWRRKRRRWRCWSSKKALPLMPAMAGGKECSGDIFFEFFKTIRRNIHTNEYFIPPALWTLENRLTRFSMISLDLNDNKRFYIPTPWNPLLFQKSPMHQTFGSRSSKSCGTLDRECSGQKRRFFTSNNTATYPTNIKRILWCGM